VIAPIHLFMLLNHDVNSRNTEQKRATTKNYTGQINSLFIIVWC